jgi:4-amino-4-deoxy-L-arabinose transferase-like glycosyltransferase
LGRSQALRRIPTWAWLAAIVAGSALVRAALARDIVAPFIMVDEIIWSEIARGIADAGEPLLRDQTDPGYSVVYPLLISPAYALFERLPEAYAAVKTTNAVLMSLAAIPAFSIARRVVRDGLALLAALLAVAVPSLAYTGTVMTENAFYPLFLLVVLLLLVVLERPTAPWVVLLLALVGLAFATRVQAVALGPAVLLAPFVLAIFEPRGLRSTISRYRWLYGLVAALAIALLVVQLASGRSPQDLLGAYSPVGERSYDVGEALRYLWWHAAELSLYVLVIPLAATVVLVARARSLDARLQAFLAATISITVCIVPVVATFASEFSDRIEERNMFYVAPLLCIALLAWVERGAPRPRVLAPIAAVVSALLVVAIPFDRFLTTSAITDTLMLLPLWSLQDRIGEDWIRLAALALAAGLAATFLLVPPRYALGLPLLVLGLWILSIRPIWWGTHGFEQFSRGALFQGIRTADRDWIDRALAPGTQAAFLWTGRTDRLTVNENEFFNRRVGPVYYVTDPTPGGLPETRVRVDPKTGRVTLPDGAPVRDEYLLADSSFEPDGERIARDKGWGITLWRVATPLVSAVRVDGLYPNDTWSGGEVTYLRRRCEPGRLAVDLSSDPSLFLEPQTIVARSNGAVVGRVRLPPQGRAVLSVPVRPVAGTSDCRVAYKVTPTAVPAEIPGGANPDDRELGAHFNRFVYRPAR